MESQKTDQERPLLIMFLGSAGSGKSYFAKHLAERINAVRLNGDSMRIAIFGSVEAITNVYNSENRQTVNSYVFNAIDYAASQILLRGHTVVYDAHHNRRKTRAELEKLAASYDAVPIVVRINTPYEVALKRGQEREVLVDQRRLSEEEMREVMDRHKRQTDEPIETEAVIDIDGLLPFEQQYESYCYQLKMLTSE